MKQKRKRAVFKMNSKNSNSGQTTAFIVIGIVIILAVIYGIYVINKVSVAKIKPLVPELPTQLMPVKYYIERCVYDTAVDGLTRIGATGGYIDLDSAGLKANELEPTEGDAVPAFSTTVAYWWYLKSDNKCTGVCEFGSNQPNLYRESGEPSIEHQMDVYITTNLKNCFQDFQDLREQGYELLEKGNPIVKTSVNEQDFGVYIIYPLEIRKGQDKFEITEFYSAIPLNLRKIFLVANNITAYEAYNETRYLERFSLELISAFSGTSQEKLPSIADTEFKAVGTVWPEPKVRELMQQILVVYVQALQVEGTLNYKRAVFQDQLKQQIYDNFIIPNRRITAPHNGLEIEFNYLNWPIYLDLNCKAGVCRPEQVFTNIMIVPFGIQRYSFAYDVSYPVVVSIKDPGALNGKGYTLNFALEANLRNNEPMDQEFYPISQTEYGDGSMLCDENKRNSGNIDIVLKDRLSDELISDAIVTFTSVGEGCMIGTTRSEKLSENKKLFENKKSISELSMSTKLPVACGYLSFTKENYLGKSRYLCTQLGKDALVTEQLEPYRNVNITVMKKKIAKMGSSWEFLNREFPLVFDEEATVVIEKLQEPGEEEFSAGFVINSEEKEAEINLVPGKYKVTANLILNQPLVIPERKMKQCQLFGIACTETTIPETRFNTYLEGMLEWDSERTAWILSAEKLDSVANGNGKIVLYILAGDLANIPEKDRRIEDISAIGDLGQKSREYAVYLIPEFKKETEKKLP